MPWALSSLALPLWSEFLSGHPFFDLEVRGSLLRWRRHPSALLHDCSHLLRSGYERAQSLTLLQIFYLFLVGFAAVLFRKFSGPASSLGEWEGLLLVVAALASPYVTALVRKVSSSPSDLDGNLLAEGIVHGQLIPYVLNRAAPAESARLKYIERNELNEPRVREVSSVMRDSRPLLLFPDFAADYFSKDVLHPEANLGLMSGLCDRDDRNAVQRGDNAAKVRPAKPIKSDVEMEGELRSKDCTVLKVEMRALEDKEAREVHHFRVNDLRAIEHLRKFYIHRFNKTGRTEEDRALCVRQLAARVDSLRTNLEKILRSNQRLDQVHFVDVRGPLWEALGSVMKLQ